MNSRFLLKNSTGSIFSLAARSSSAEQVRNEACGWFGARQARIGPVFSDTAEWFRRKFGILVNTYGSGAMPPPPKPPVDQDSDCQAVMVPSFFAPTLILAKCEGRTPAMVNSVARSRKTFTGLPPLALDRCALSICHRSAGNLLPNPPPM